MSKVAFIFLILAGMSSVGVHGQSCRPAVLDYIVRDEKGRPLGQTELEAVYKSMPKAADGFGTVDVAQDGTLVGYSAKEAKSKLPVIYYANAAACRIKVPEFTLKHAGRTMRLVFRLDIDRRTYVIDSLPFQTGTFTLDQTSLAEAVQDQIVPARRWKRTSKKP